MPKRRQRREHTWLRLQLIDMYGLPMKTGPLICTSCGLREVQTRKGLSCSGRWQHARLGTGKKKKEAEME